MLNQLILVRERINFLTHDLHSLSNGECHTRLQLIVKYIDHVIDEAIDENERLQNGSKN